MGLGAWPPFSPFPVLLIQRAEGPSMCQREGGQFAWAVPGRLITEIFSFQGCPTGTSHELGGEQNLASAC